MQEGWVGWLLRFMSVFPIADCLQGGRLLHCLNLDFVDFKIMGIGGLIRLQPVS